MFIFKLAACISLHHCGLGWRWSDRALLRCCWIPGCCYRGLHTVIVGGSMKWSKISWYTPVVTLDSIKQISLTTTSTNRGHSPLIAHRNKVPSKPHGFKVAVEAHTCCTDSLNDVTSAGRQRLFTGCPGFTFKLEFFWIGISIVAKLWC